MLLAWLADQDTDAVEALLTVALDANPGAVEARLASLWMGLPLNAEEQALVDDLQVRFDCRCPERVSALREEAASLARALTRDVDLSLETPDAKRWEAIARRLEQISDTRSFDSVIRFKEATGASKAIGHYGFAGRFDDLARWGRRLAAVASAFPDHPAVRLEESKGAANAIAAYSGGQFNDLERWGTRLASAAAAFPDDPAIRLAEVQGAVNAVIHCGRAGQFEDRKRWLNVFAAIAERFPADLQIQQLASEHGVAFSARSLATTHNEHAGRWPWPSTTRHAGDQEAN